MIRFILIASLVACAGAEELPETDPETAAPDTTDLWAQAREEMVHTQIADRGVSDQRLLEALKRVPRHELVPEPYRHLDSGRNLVDGWQADECEVREAESFAHVSVWRREEQEKEDVMHGVFRRWEPGISAARSVGSRRPCGAGLAGTANLPRRVHLFQADCRAAKRIPR